jgi:hypothetical protein
MWGMEGTGNSASVIISAVAAGASVAAIIVSLLAQRSSRRQSERLVTLEQAASQKTNAEALREARRLDMLGRVRDEASIALGGVLEWLGSAEGLAASLRISAEFVVKKREEQHPEAGYVSHFWEHFYPDICDVMRRYAPQSEHLVAFARTLGSYGSYLRLDADTVQSVAGTCHRLDTLVHELSSEIDEAPAPEIGASVTSHWEERIRSFKPHATLLHEFREYVSAAFDAEVSGTAWPSCDPILGALAEVKLAERA